MRWRDRRRRALVLLAAGAALLGAGAGAPARAQEAPEGQTGEDLFGTYDLEARGQGVQTYYEVEGMLPGGAAVLDLGIPEALARFGSGPIGYGVASLAYPGGLIVNLGSLVEQSGGGSAQDVPAWPMKEEAFFPTGPTEAGDDPQPGAPTQRVRTGDLGVEVLAEYPQVDATPAITVGAVRTLARSAIEEGKAVSRSRVVVSDVNVLGGVLSMESVSTDLVSVHDGQQGTTAGGTTVSGLRFLGLAASLTDEGLVLDEAPPVEGPGAPLGDVLDPLVPGLQGALSPVQEALQQVLDQATPQLDEVLATLGIELSIAAPEETQAEEGAASRVSSGLSLRLRYEGREQDALFELIQAIPQELRPSLGPIPNPVTFLTENHIGGISIAPASVMSLATPPFPEFVVDDLPIDQGAGVSAPVTGGGADFETPVPDLPAAAPEGAAGGDGAGFAAEPVSAVLSGAVPALLVIMALLSAPLFGLGSSRLADNVLAPAGAACPLGLDEPPSPTRPS